MTYPHDERPIWRRPKFYVPMGIVGVIVGLIISLVVTSGGEPRELTFDDLASGALGGPTNGASRSLGVDQYGPEPGTPEWKAWSDNEAAKRTRQEHSRHFECREYPSDDKLTPGDLIPTGNVAMVIRFDEKKGVYKVTHDPRIKLRQWDTREAANSDVDHPFTLTPFRWTYAEGVAHYGTFSTYRSSEPGNPWRWSGGPLSYDMRSQTFNIEESPENGTSNPLYVVIATDTRSCKAGAVAVPKEFDWQNLAQRGLLPPYEPDLHGAG